MPEASSFLIGAYHGSGDQERLGSGSGPSDHPKCHALLRAVVVGLDPLELAFWGQPSMAIDQGTGSAPSLERRPSFGPLLSGSHPNSRELIGFGGASPEHPSIRGSGCFGWGGGAAPEAIVGPPYL
jgi:hypothetical protein